MFDVDFIVFVDLFVFLFVLCQYGLFIDGVVVLLVGDKCILVFDLVIGEIIVIIVDVIVVDVDCVVVLVR